MTDTTTPEPERPFDPRAAARLTALLDEGGIKPGRNELAAQDIDTIREVLRQRAYARSEATQLAEKCARIRGEYEDEHARADHLQALADERAQTIIELGDQLRQASEQLAEREDKAVDQMADKLLAETRLRSLEIRGGNFEMELTEAQDMAAAYVAMCRTMLGDAENYAETPVGFPKAKTELTVKIAESAEDWYVLTVQRKWKLTPHEARRRAEAERDQARTATLAALDRWHPTWRTDRKRTAWYLGISTTALPDWLSADADGAETTQTGTTNGGSASWSEA